MLEEQVPTTPRNTDPSEITLLATDVVRAHDWDATARIHDDVVRPEATKRAGRFVTGIFKKDKEPSAQPETAIPTDFERRNQLLSMIRQKVKNLEPSQLERLDSYLSTHLPPFMEVQRKEELATWRPTFIKTPKKILSPTEWLMGTDSNPQEQAIKDERLTNFLQWHLHTLEEQTQHPMVLEKIDEIRAEYKSDVRKGIKEGWLAADRGTATEQVDGVRVVIGDLFDTAIKGWGGYARAAQRLVVIAQGTYHTRLERRFAGPQRIAHVIRNLKHALKHEYNHAVLGEMHDRWINEALTEHIRQVFEGGDLETIRVSEREGDDTTYEPERSLLDVLHNYGAIKIPIRVATLAYSSPKTGLARYSQELRDYNSVLEQAWGSPMVLNDIQRKLDEYEKELRNQGKDSRQAEIEALGRVQSDLLQQPEVVFGDWVRKAAAIASNL